MWFLIRSSYLLPLHRLSITVGLELQDKATLFFLKLSFLYELFILANGTGQVVRVKGQKEVKKCLLVPKDELRLLVREMVLKLLFH